MSKFKVEFTLKQHTPIIHFQSGQAGATLRATELKPKLDRFLIEYAFDSDFEKYKTYLIGYNEPKKHTDKVMTENDFKGKKAFDYKVKLIPSEEIKTFDIAPIYEHYDYKKKETKERPLGFPIFFASIDKEWTEKSKKIKFSLSDNIQATIITFNPDLKVIIDKSIALFFYLHNFGMRQSKGFGSFTVSGGDIDSSIVSTHYYIDIDINYLNHKDNLKFNKELNNTFLKPITNDYKDSYLLFKAIDLFYKTLRSGINVNKFYFKSLMFLYAKENLNIQWDKKLFKSNFLSPTYITEQLTRHCKSNCKDILTYKTKHNYLLRDCLGLSTIQEYNFSRDYAKSEKFTIRHPNTDSNKKDKFKEKDIEPNEINRLQSPLFLKPIKIKNKFYRVYIIAKDYPDEVFEKNITILKVKNNKVEKKLDNLRLYPNFDLNEYLDFAFSQNITNHLIKCGTSSKLLESQLLIKIYSQLNQQSKIKLSHE